MRADEFISERQKLDELLPLITGAASLAGGAMKLAGGVAAGAGAAAKGIGKGVGAVARGVGNVAGAAGNKAATAIGAQKPQQPQQPDLKQAQAINRAKDQLVRPGSKIDLPTQGAGGPQSFKITKVQGDEVELENPDGNKSPNQPNKLIYKKSDVKNTINI